MSDIAHQHQRAAFQAGGLATSSCKGYIVGKTAGNDLAALLEAFFERTFHQTKPVAIGQNLILGIHTGNRILAIHDARHRRFGDHIIDAGLIVAANGAAGIYLDQKMQTIIAQNDGCRLCCVAVMADKASGVSKGC